VTAASDPEGDVSLSAVLGRLELAEARLELYDLEGRYARTWDTADAEAWAALFTEDGVFEAAAVGGEPGRAIRGHDELEALCRHYTGSVTGLHLLHLPELTVDGDRATSRLHFDFRSVRRSSPDATGLAEVSGYYDTTYARGPSGWRILYRFEKAVARSRAVFFDL
jgi:hypothetical protein